MGRNSIMFPISRLLTAFVLFIVFTGPTSEAAPSQSDQQYDVLILGGGFAGITAANHLHKNGVKNVLVIEAQDYIGGRLKNTQIGDYTFGEGANWVHYLEEKEDNPIRVLVEKIKLAGHVAKDKDIIVKNTELNEDDFKKAMKVIEDAEGKIEELKNEMTLTGDAAMSKTLKIAINGWSPENNPLQRAVEWYVYDYEYTINPDVMSTLNYYGLPEKNYIITDKRGYAEIINHLMKNLTDITIKTKAEISQVTYKNYLVTVITKTGETFTGKYALCTFSTGVLGSKHVTFKPQLPDWKMNAVEKIRMGYYTHVLVQFKKMFWENNEFIINIEKGPDIGPFPVIYNLNHEHIHPGSNLLLFTAVGIEGVEIETQNDDQARVKVNKAINKMYPQTGDEIADIFISRWSMNPYVRGSYSYASVGTTKNHFANLMGRVGNLFFAGEACDADYFGYLQGAYRTGVHQADIIATCVKSEGIDCPPYTHGK